MHSYYMKGIRYGLIKPVKTTLRFAEIFRIMNSFPGKTNIHKLETV